MRKLFLLLVLNLSLAAMAINPVSQDETSNTGDYKPMLVEGRTWWYTSRHRSFDFVAENGISVGEEVEIDGVNWHKINLVSNAVRESDTWLYDTKLGTIAYMREDDGKIYTAYFDNYNYFESISEYCGDFTHEVFKTQLTYEYLDTGMSYTYGNNEHFGTAIIKNVSKLMNSGFEYALFECDFEFESRPFFQDLNFIEGLGCITDHFFFDPVCGGYSSPTIYDFPQLRYITDPDGTIIYEGIGGYKLWERSGVDNVSVDDEDCRWYNLQGFEISEPTSPGVYIRSKHNDNEKVFIR